MPHPASYGKKNQVSVGIICLAIPSGSPYLSSFFLIILVWSRPLFLALVSSLPMFILSMISPSSARLNRLTLIKCFSAMYLPRAEHIPQLSWWLFYLIGSQKHLKLWICLKQQVLPAPNLPQPWCSPALCIGDFAQTTSSCCTDSSLSGPTSHLHGETLLCCSLSNSTSACFHLHSLPSSSVTCISVSQTFPWC